MRDRHAFQQLYALTSARLFGVLLHLLRSRAVAEEILHDSFISIWQHAGTYIPARSQPMTWMTSIARHRALDHLRAERVPLHTLDADTEELPETSPTVLEQMILSAQNNALRECLRQLDTQTRQIVAAAFYRGLSHGQLAQEFKTPLGTVKSWIRRGLQRLRVCIEQADTVAE